jgi:hypothetical protein
VNPLRDNTSWPPANAVPDVLCVLDLARQQALFIGTGTVTVTGWSSASYEPAWPLPGAQSEAATALLERGALAPGEHCLLLDESGDPIEADLVAITDTGRALFDRLDNPSPRR